MYMEVLCGQLISAIGCRCVTSHVHENNNLDLSAMKRDREDSSYAAGNPMKI